MSILSNSSGPNLKPTCLHVGIYVIKRNGVNSILKTTTTNEKLVRAGYCSIRPVRVHRVHALMRLKRRVPNRENSVVCIVTQAEIQ